MKRIMAFLLAVWMMAASCAGAWAQPLRAEELLAALLEVMGEQLMEPSLAVHLDDGVEQADLGIALDDQGIPDLYLDAKMVGQRLRLDADAAGLRYDDGALKVAVAPMELLRALFTDEAGVCFLPDVAQEDLALLEGAVGELITAVSGAVEIERYAAQKDPAAEAVDGESAQDEQTTVMIDVQMLLTMLDAAVPVVLTKYAAQIDSFTARNAALLCELFGVSSIAKAEEMAQLWPAGMLSGLLPQDLPVMITLMIGPGDAFGLAVLGGEEELLLVSYGEGRLVAQLGSGENALIMDSDDLADIAALLEEATGRVTPEAISWRYDEDEWHIRASFHLDPNRLVRDLVDGLAAAVQNHEAMISALLERYMPWLEAAGARGVTWEALTQELLENRSKITNGFCRWMAYGMGIPGSRLFVNVKALPALDVEMALPKRLNRGSTGSLSVRSGGMQLHAALSQQHLNAALQLSDTPRITRFELLGLLEESGGRLTLGRYNRNQLEAEITLNVQEADGVISAWLHDEDGTELASFYMDGSSACLTSGELVIEAVDTSSGLVITGSHEMDRFGGQISTDGRELSASGYMNGANAQLQIVNDRDELTLWGSYKPQRSMAGYQVALRMQEKGLSLDAGEYNSGIFVRGVEADVVAMPDGLHLNLEAKGRRFGTLFSYRPGLLEFSHDGDWMKWVIRAADMTGQAEDQVRVKVDVQRLDKSQSGALTFINTYDVTVREGGVNALVFEIADQNGRTTHLTLDFDAKAQAEDLTGYLWLTAPEAAQVLHALLTPPEPEATAQPQAETAAADIAQ